jgi:cell wall-associated NlpC family hydrolase
MDQLMRRLGLRESEGPVRRGDVVQFRVGACQFHFGIAAGDGTVVHAHAGLRRVIRGEAPADWQLCRKWRLADPA